MYCINIFHLTFPVPQFLLQYCDIQNSKLLKSFEILTKILSLVFFFNWERWDCYVW